MVKPLRLLLVEDSEDDAALVVRALQQARYQVDHKRVQSAEDLRLALQDLGWQLIISDHSMPSFTGTSALAIVRGMGLDTPFIFVSGTIGEDAAVEAMRVGAQDYITKGNLARLVPAVERELREADNRRERKQVEQRLRQLEKFEVIGQLAGGIAHDFNNVIGGIMGWAELGIREVPDGTRAAKFFQQIRDNSERAAGLTRQLLAYARRQILERRKIDLNKLVTEAMELIMTVAGERIEVRAELAPDLQPSRADHAQVEQVVMNLCVNARDAMPNGGQLMIQTCNITLDDAYCEEHSYARPGKYVRISVTDTGTGMDSATLERIFEPFFTTKPKGKGTGLGLATTLGIIKQHDGFVEVLSEIGQGTIFHVYLPAAEGPAEAMQEKDDSPVRGGSETILIADDNTGVREVTQEVLESLGYHVIAARDGEEALELFKANRNDISLLVLDIVMPKLQGPEAYVTISQLRPEIPIIFVSGYTDEEKSLETLAAKGLLVLQKPYGPKVLARKVRELLDRASGGRLPS